MTRFSDLEPAPVDCYQSLIEFGALWEYCAAIDPVRVVEIGSLFGGTLWYWLQLPDLVQVVSVDLVTDWEPVRDGVREARAQWSTWPRTEDGRLCVIERDSHDPETVDIVRGRPIDVLFIDGDHVHPEYDFALWQPLVRSGGIVAFHDTVPNGTRHEPGVVACVSVLKDRFPSVEWFEPDGVGITAFVMP